MSRRERLTLIATILASTVVFLDATVVNVALPAMERNLGMGLAGQQWVVEAYLLALVSMMLVGGSLGDHFGRRRIFSIGLAGFGATSILCALAPSTGFLIGLRALQGLAGALLVPGSLAILTATFQGEARGRAIGTWTAWSGISTIAGPAAGGFLTPTLTIYAGLIGSSFFLTLYLQQVAGYTALAAGFAGVPISLLLFFLSPRFGAFTARVGPRLPMSAGPIVGGLGLLMLMRVGVNPSYPTEVLPALVVFGLGLSATVAPLTTTVLNAVDEHNAGIASGVNNAIARVAGLLAIAAIGAVISGQFASTLDSHLPGTHLSPQAADVVASANSQPL